MAKFAKKTTLGYKPVAGGSSNSECTHVILTLDEYDGLKREISSAQQAARNAEYNADKKINQIQSEAQSRITHTEKEMAKNTAEWERKLAAEQQDRKELKLSELFSIPDADPSLELKAVMLNINKGHNRKLMETCRTLQDYAEYTFRVREYAAEMPLDLAVEQAITECISEGILADFLRKNRAEAKKVSIYEYDEERHMRQTREEGMEEGYANGFSQGIEQGITQTVINLLKSGLLTDIQIREITGLDQKQLDELKKK